MPNYEKKSFLNGLTSNLIARTTTPAGLEDFYYVRNEDGTFTIFKWKGTLNGKASTICSIPNNPLIILQLREEEDIDHA